MRRIFFVVLLTIFFYSAFNQALAINSNTLNRLSELFENIIAGTSNPAKHNFCRIIKNLNQDTLSCEIYQNYPDGHSELATRIDLDDFPINPNPIKPADEQKKINNYGVYIRYDKVYAGPMHPKITIKTHIFQLTSSLKMTITCWEHHKCYAEEMIKSLDKQKILKITGGR